MDDPDNFSLAHGDSVHIINSTAFKAVSIDRVIIVLNKCDHWNCYMSCLRKIL